MLFAFATVVLANEALATSNDPEMLAAVSVRIKEALVPNEPDMAAAICAELDTNVLATKLEWLDVFVDISVSFVVILVLMLDDADVPSKTEVNPEPSPWNDPENDPEICGALIYPVASNEPVNFINDPEASIIPVEYVVI